MAQLLAQLLEQQLCMALLRLALELASVLQSLVRMGRPIPHMIVLRSCPKERFLSTWR
jgi:hypothetical protein